MMVRLTRAEWRTVSRARECARRLGGSSMGGVGRGEEVASGEELMLSGATRGRGRRLVGAGTVGVWGDVVCVRRAGR